VASGRDVNGNYEGRSVRRTKGWGCLVAASGRLSGVHKRAASKKTATTATRRKRSLDNFDNLEEAAKAEGKEDRHCSETKLQNKRVLRGATNAVTFCPFERELTGS
jgi:hypothetical protein